MPCNEISVDHHLVNQSQMWSANGNKGELSGVEMDRHAQHIRADRYHLQFIQQYYYTLYQVLDCDPIEAEYFFNFLVPPMDPSPV